MNELFQPHPVLLIQAGNVVPVYGGEIGFTHDNLLLILCACLERRVHRLETLPRRLQEPFPEQRHQHAGERLGLAEAAASRPLLQTEGVLAVEQAGHEQPAAPAQLPLLRERHHGRPEGDRLPPWRLDAHPELAALSERGVDGGDERVPGRVAVHVGEHLPDAPPRRGDVGPSLDGAHPLPSQVARCAPATGATAAKSWRPSQACTSSSIRSPSIVIRLYAFGSSRSRVEVAVAAWTISGPDGVGSIGASTSAAPASGNATVGGPSLAGSGSCRRVYE